MTSFSPARRPNKTSTMFAKSYCSSTTLEPRLSTRRAASSPIQLITKATLVFLNVKSSSHTQRMLSRNLMSQQVSSNRGCFYAYSTTLDYSYPNSRESRLCWTNDWRKSSQKYFHRLSANNFKPWIHWGTHWYHLLRWHFHILVDTWHSTPTRAIYRPAASTKKATRRQDKTHLLLFTFAHQHRATIRHHAMRMPSHCLVRSTSPAIPRRSTFHNPNWSRCPLGDTSPGWLNKKTRTLAPPLIENWFWRHLLCWEKALRGRQSLATLRNR